LIRAYKNCTESTLKNTAIDKIIEWNRYVIELVYEDLAPSYRWIEKSNTIFIDCRINENKASLIIWMEKFEAIDFKEGFQRLDLNYKTEEK